MPDPSEPPRGSTDTSANAKPSLLPEASSPASVTEKSPVIVLVAGEASGDLLGADLIADLRVRWPRARFVGIGGPKMAEAGMHCWYPARKLSVMGLVEVLRHLPSLLRIRRDVFKRTLAARPAVFIGIDAPDFNLGLERKLKRNGVRTIHYVSPSVWAWRERRAEKIGRSADRVLCLFPMEPAIYARHGIDARFVGHPLARSFAMHPDQSSARGALCLPADVPVLALLPGSRLGEIRRLGHDFLSAAARIRQQLPQLHIVAPMANDQCRVAFSSLLEQHDFAASDVCILDGNAHAAMIAADAVLLASGTAALEAMLAKRQMVVAYRVAPLTYWLVKTLGLLKISAYSLPNILAGKVLVPELMQDACTPEALAATLLPMLRLRELEPALRIEFESLHASLLAEPDHNAAAAVSELIKA